MSKRITLAAHGSYTQLTSWLARSLREIFGSVSTSIAAGASKPEFALRTTSKTRIRPISASVLPLSKAVPATRYDNCSDNRSECACVSIDVFIREILSSCHASYHVAVVKTEGLWEPFYKYATCTEISMVMVVVASPRPATNKCTHRDIGIGFCIFYNPQTANRLHFFQLKCRSHGLLPRRAVSQTGE